MFLELKECEECEKKAGGYKDVHSEVKILPITYKHACEFLRPLNVDFDRTVIDLYDNKFHVYLRVCLTEELDFIKSSCHAEMKKKITYMVDISVKKMVMCMKHSVSVRLGKDHRVTVNI